MDAVFDFSCVFDRREYVSVALVQTCQLPLECFLIGPESLLLNIRSVCKKIIGQTHTSYYSKLLRVAAWIKKCLLFSLQATYWNNLSFLFYGSFQMILNCEDLRNSWCFFLLKK